MAEGFNGKTVLAYIDTDTPVTTAGTSMTLANFRVMVCLTNNTFDGTTSPIATTSKCSGNWTTSIAGEQSWTMSADLNSEILSIPDEAIKASHNEMFKLWRAGTEFWMAQYDTALNTVRYGVVRIDGDSEAYANNAQATVSVTFTGIGEPFDQDDLAGS